MDMEKWEAGNIDIEKVMKEIKEKVRKRKELGTYFTQEIDSRGVLIDKYNICSDINYLNGKSNLSNYSYLIDSHRGQFGKLLVKGRQIVHEEVKRYVDPIFLMQSEWNAAAGRVIREYDVRLSYATERLKTLEQKVSSNERIDTFNDDCYDELSEEKLLTTIHQHEYFLDIIRSYALKSESEKKPKIIGIGSKSGVFSIYLSKKSNFDVYEIENSIYTLFHALKNNEKLGGDVKFMLVDYFNLNTLKTKYFDVAFSQGTLENFDVDSIIKILWNLKNLAKYVVFSISPEFSFFGEKSTDDEYKIVELNTFLKNAGFNVLLLEYYADNNYIIGLIGE